MLCTLMIAGLFVGSGTGPALLPSAALAWPASLPQDAALALTVDLDGDGFEELIEVAPGGRSVRIVSTRGALGRREFSFPVPATVLHVATLDWQGDGVREIGLVTTAGVLVESLDGTPVAAFLAPLERGELVPFHERGTPGDRALVLGVPPGADDAVLAVVDRFGPAHALGRLAPDTAARFVEEGAPERVIAGVVFRAGGPFGVGPLPLAGEAGSLPPPAQRVSVPRARIAPR